MLRKGLNLFWMLLVNDIIDINEEYENYNDLRADYRQLMEENTTKSHRSFSFRIEASYSLKDSLVEWINDNTNTKQKECYKLYLLLVDAWFSYEALLRLAEDEGFSAKSAPKPEKLLKNKLPNENFSDIISDFYNELKPILTKEKRKQSLLNYIDILMNYTTTKPSQKKHLVDLKNKLYEENYSDDNYYKVLAFVYAIRNAYVHEGETAYSGTEHYIVKKMILLNAYKFILKFIFRSASFIYEHMIDTIS